MSDRTLYLKDVFKSSSLITRESARELFRLISEIPEKRIILNFENIDFASRSFFDELNSKMSQIKLLGKEIEFINLVSQISELYRLVKGASKSKSSFSYPSIANAKTVTI